MTKIKPEPLKGKTYVILKSEPIANASDIRSAVECAIENAECLVYQSGIHDCKKNPEGCDLVIDIDTLKDIFEDVMK